MNVSFNKLSVINISVGNSNTHISVVDISVTNIITNRFVINIHVTNLSVVQTVILHTRGTDRYFHLFDVFTITFQFPQHFNSKNQENKNGSNKANHPEE